jgi:hypothetical protein
MSAGERARRGMGYAEAIEQQVRFLAALRSPAGRRWCSEFCTFFGEAIPDFLHTEQVFPMLLYGLEHAETYAVAGPICSLLEGAAGTMPPCPLRQELVPASAGWVMFERPLSLGGGEWAVDGLLWLPITVESWERDALLVFVCSKRATEKSGLRGTAMPIAVFGWAIGDSPMYGLGAGNYLAAFFTFIQQRIFVANARPIAHRAKRRQLRAVLMQEPLVRVIELRRREHLPRESTEHEPAEWSCHWLVRGHWHRYHTREGLQPRWVNPYVKGPDDKPFKAPRATVYEVVR